MEKEHVKEILEQAIQLEMNVGDLYMLYYHIFKEDKEFWWKISAEERNHAALLESSKPYIELGRFPLEIINTNYNELKDINIDIFEKIKKYKDNIPSKEEAYNYALKLESSAYEAHFQELISNDGADDTVIRILRKLNGDDKDHYDRIKNLMDYSAIEVKEGIKIWNR